MFGITAGKITFVIVLDLDAPSDLETFSTSESTDCTPIAVLIRVGQMLVMKMTNIPVTSEFLNTNKPIGNHASGETGFSN